MTDLREFLARSANRWAVGLVGLAISTSASAVDPTTCAAPYSSKTFVENMDVAEAQVNEFDIDAFRGTLEQIHEGILCTFDHVHPNHLTRFGRLMSLAAFFDQDEMTSHQWAHMANLAGKSPWPMGMDDTHPFRSALLEMEEPWITGPEGAGVHPPKGGALLLDGHLLTQATAAAEVPHFVQVLGKDGVVFDNNWQDGPAFPVHLLKLGTEPPPTPKWYMTPHPGLDPLAPVEDDPQALARAEAAKREAAALQAAQEDRLLRMEEASRVAEAKASKQAQKEAAKAAKKSSKVAVAEVDDAPEPVQWVDMSGPAADLGALGAHDATIDIDCTNLMRLEPRALVGKLKGAEIQCLEASIKHAEKQTRADSISRVLMADAWAKKVPHRWEAAIRRHLVSIDRSDAELCYIFARYLAKEGTDHIQETIRWSEVALVNAYREWESDLLVRRVYSLHRLKALASRQKWFEAEQDYLADSSRERMNATTKWRSTTKVMAREWLMYAVDSGKDTDVPYQVCISAAGTEAYCRFGQYADDTAEAEAAEESGDE